MMSDWQARSRLLAAAAVRHQIADIQPLCGGAVLLAALSPGRCRASGGPARTATGEQPPVDRRLERRVLPPDANGDNRSAIGLVVQVDGRFALDDPLPITNTFVMRKVRPTFTGRVARYFDFKIMPELAGNGRRSSTPTSTSASRRNFGCAAARTRRRSATSC